MKSILILLLLCSVGCRSTHKATDTIKSTSAVAVMSPVIVGVGSYVGTQKSLQKTAIMTKAPNKWFSSPITKEQLNELMFPNSKFLGELHYMGTKNNKHYISHTVIGRKIYHINVNEHKFEKPFKLTARSWKWRRIPIIYKRIFNGNIIQ